MSVPKIVEVLAKIDPKKVEARFPTRQMYDEYERARSELLLPLLKQVDDRKPLTPELVHKMEQVSEIFERIGKSVTSDTELGGRSSVNQVYHWVKAGYVERSVFLAGVAKDRRLRQPYATQIQLLPAHACLLRFRQSTKVSVYVARQEQTGERDEALQILTNSRASWLYQMKNFAQDAYDADDQRDDDGHPMANYLLALSCLLEAHEIEARGATAEALVAMAARLIEEIAEPREGIHYMKAQYHEMNYEEFVSFQRLSARYPDITARLKTCATRVKQLRDDEKLTRPREWSEIGTYLGLAGRAASVLLVVGTALNLAGVTMESARDAINAIWVAAIDTIPGLRPGDGALVALHGGGAPLIDLPSPFSIHGGGAA